jgi:hypothetical protein
LRLLFIPTEPATTDVIATWTMSIDRDTGGGRHAATLTRTVGQGLPTRTDLTLWYQGTELWMDAPQGPRLALEMEVPPGAVAVEKVPCIVHFIDSLGGTCSPAPGGPLAVPPGPTLVVVSEGTNPGASIAQVLVGIGTAGLIIPGNRSASEYATLIRWTPKNPAPEPARITAWKASPRPDALAPLLPGVGREEAAAMVALARPEDLALVAAPLMDALPASDRVPVLRVALQSDWGGSPRLRLLATLSAHLGAPLDPVRLASVTRLFDGDQADAARGVLTGEWPLLLAVLRADPAASGLSGAPGHTPSDAELQAVIAQFDPPGDVLPALLARTPPERQVALLSQVCRAETFDDARFALIQANPAVVARAAEQPGMAEQLLDTFAFDEQRVAAVKLLVAAAPPRRRGALVRVGVEAMDFDDGRLAVLDALPAEAREMNAADRKAMLNAFTFERDAAEARLRGPGR